MRFPIFPRALLLSGLLLAAWPHPVLAQDAQLTLTPDPVRAGSPELVRVAAPGAKQVQGEWLGQKIQFFPGKDGEHWFALTGVDVEAPNGPSTLHIAITPAGGGQPRQLTQAVEIGQPHYPTGTLTVAPQFVEPSPEAIKQIESEVAFKQKIFTQSAPEPLWQGDFHAPVTAPATSTFGTRRMFNGKLASVHKGMDFRAASGTPVRAGNSGVVVLARPLYFEGNCVAIDHGLGLYTISMHLSRIDVHEGQRVTQGQRVGLSGATGRVTGPHLHWAVRWQSAYLDPARLLKMNLAAAH
jgi:murein DD-endopeptidase MepM/ murein hydrolase activator NlpD